MFALRRMRRTQRVVRRRTRMEAGGLVGCAPRGMAYRDCDRRRRAAVVVHAPCLDGVVSTRRTLSCRPTAALGRPGRRRGAPRRPVQPWVPEVSALRPIFQVNRKPMPANSGNNPRPQAPMPERDKHNHYRSHHRHGDNGQRHQTLHVEHPVPTRCSQTMQLRCTLPGARIQRHRLERQSCGNSLRFDFFCLPERVQQALRSALSDCCVAAY